MLLHGSKVQFDNFRIPSHGNELSGASNGMLGTWFCRETHAFIAEGYGREGWVAEVAEPCSDDVVEIPLGKFIRWHEEADRDDPAAYYGDIRSKLLARGRPGSRWSRRMDHHRRLSASLPRISSSRTGEASASRSLNKAPALERVHAQERL